MKKCNRIFCLLFAFLFLFGSFSVSAYASNTDYENLVSSNLSTWNDYSEIDSSCTPITRFQYDSTNNFTNIIIQAPVTLGSYYAIYDISSLSLGDTYRISFNITEKNYSLAQFFLQHFVVQIGLAYMDSSGSLQFDDGCWFELNSNNVSNYVTTNNFDFKPTSIKGTPYIVILISCIQSYDDTGNFGLSLQNFSLTKLPSEESEKLDGVLGFLDTIKNALVDMQTDIRNFFNNIGTYFSNLGDRIGGFFDTLLTNDDENTANIGQGLVDIWQRIIDKLTFVADGVANDINNSWQQTVIKLETVKNQISAEITSSWQNIVSKLNDLKVNIVNSLSDLGTNIINGIKDLFIPSDDFFENYSQMYYDLASDRFGALFTVFDISDNFIKSFDADKTIEYIDIPLYNFDLMGFNFQFGGWKMYIIPQFDVFTEIVSTIKGFLSVLASFAFIRALKSRYDEIFGG